MINKTWRLDSDLIKITCNQIPANEWHSILISSWSFVVYLDNEDMPCQLMPVDSLQVTGWQPELDFIMIYQLGISYIFQTTLYIRVYDVSCLQSWGALLRLKCLHLGVKRKTCSAEKEVKTTSKRKPHESYSMKRNKKGETPLHVAAIKVLLHLYLLCMINHKPLRHSV